MKGREGTESGLKTRRIAYRDTARMLRQFLVPMDPDPTFSRRLEELCQDLGGDEFLWKEWEPKAYSNGRKGIIIGGAIFSALPFMGVAAYALRRHILRRRVLPIGI
jgi:hypothetical protein